MREYRDLSSKLWGRLGLVTDVVGDYKSWRAARNYLIGDTHKRVYHYHIPKTGGTSLNYIFLALAGEQSSITYKRLLDSPSQRVIVDDKVYVGWNRWLIRRGNYFYAWSHRPKHKLTLPEHTFTVTCLRDPESRVLSHYSELLSYRQHNVHHPYMRQAGHWLGNSDLTPENSNSGKESPPGKIGHSREGSWHGRGTQRSRS